MSKISKEKLRNLIQLEVKALMDEDALFVTRDIPGDDDLYQDYSLSHIDDDEHAADCGCSVCGHEDHIMSHPQNYMAAGQLELIAQHASDILQIVNSGRHLEDWQESHIAQIADDIIEVMHSLEYLDDH